MGRCAPNHNFQVGDNVIIRQVTNVTFLGRPGVVTELITAGRIKVEIQFNTGDFATTFPGNSRIMKFLPEDLEKV